jgi:ADP-ribose pyrophosphatase YjhB (NUDIX family)
LVGLRGEEPQANFWGLIGGFGETSDDGAEAGMKREKDEETRLKNDPEVRLMFSGGSGPIDQPHLRQWLIFGYAKRPIHVDALDAFVPDAETLALEVAYEPRELAFDLHTRALAEFFETYQHEVDWDTVEAA